MARDPNNADHLNNVATIYNRLASIASRRHDIQSAADHVRQGVGIRERLLKLKPDDVEIQRSLLVSYGRLGDLLGGAFENLGDVPGAIEYYRKCLAIAEGMLAKDPQSKSARSDIANSRLHLAIVLSNDSQRQESLDLLTQALSGLVSALAAAPSNANLRILAGDTLSWMAVRFRSEGDVGRAADCATRAIGHLTAPGFVANGDVQNVLVLTRQLLAILLAEQGERESALEQARLASALLKPLAGGTIASFHGTLPRYWSRVGEMYEALAFAKDSPMDRKLADWSAAKDAYRRAASEWRMTLAANREAEAALVEKKMVQGDTRIAR